MTAEMTIQGSTIARDLLTAKEATSLGYGARSTLNLWAEKGLIKKVRVGAGIRFRRSELDAMVAGVKPAKAAGATGEPARKETVQEWAERMAAAAPPMGLDVLGVVTATLREAAEVREQTELAA